MNRPRFHLAFPVLDLDEARVFFGELLGCAEGRSAPRWVDFDFFGHQISAHLHDADEEGVALNSVDGDKVPTRHFGLILAWSDWEALRDKLVRSDTRFVIEPKIRFVGQPGEQATMFVSGPSSNVLEFKAFRSDSDIFSTW
jgi:extradiol dioxygenase family protein